MVGPGGCRAGGLVHPCVLGPKSGQSPSSFVAPSCLWQLGASGVSKRVCRPQVGNVWKKRDTDTCAHVHTAAMHTCERETFCTSQGTGICVHLPRCTCVCKCACVH